MIFGRVLSWLGRKWAYGVHDIDRERLVEAYKVTFSGAQGNMVLQHLMDSVYCTACETHDLAAIAHHNGRRSVVHEILQNIDIGERPEKYKLEVTHE